MALACVVCTLSPRRSPNLAKPVTAGLVCIRCCISCSECLVVQTTVYAERISVPSAVLGSQYAPDVPLAFSMASKIAIGIRMHTENISALLAGQGLNPDRRNWRRHTSRIGSLSGNFSVLCQAGHVHVSSMHLLSFGKSETKHRMGELQNSFQSPGNSSLYTNTLRVTTSGVSMDTRVGPFAFSTKPAPSCTMTTAANTGSLLTVHRQGTVTWE